MDKRDTLFLWTDLRKMYRTPLVSLLTVFLCGFFYIPAVYADTSEPYTAHDPIIVEGAPSSSENPYTVDGYEITYPEGPGIQIRDVDYVVIRNSYVHNCGTEISEAIQERIRNGEGDASLAMMDKPFETGGILVFDAKHVEIYNNKVINNDYGIKVWGHRFRAESVSVHDNEVKKSHRSFFISVSNADNVDIIDNYVEDNGLSIFIDNKGLEAAFERGEDFPDGRSQGILTDGCNHVQIIGNTVINSNSDGIGVTQGDRKYVEDIEIAHNNVLRNGEQGLWLVKARNGTIHDNTISENRHRIDTTGGSSGINFEGRVFDFEIFDNDISCNDMYGLYFINSSDNEIYDNEIHHNGDGAIGWGEIFYWEKDDYAKENISGNIIVRNNDIHHNKKTVFEFIGNSSGNFAGKIIVENNTFAHNGGNPIHYEAYEDFDTTAHPEDWEYDGTSVILLTNSEKLKELFEIGTNTIDGEEVTGIPEEKQNEYIVILDAHVKSRNRPILPSILAQERRFFSRLGTFNAGVILGILLISFIALVAYYMRKRKRGGSKKLLADIVFVIVLCSIVIVLWPTEEKPPETQEKEKEDKKNGKKPFYRDQEFFDALQNAYCNTDLSEELIKSNENSHFGAGYPGVEYYDEMVAAGVTWERMSVFSTDDVSRMDEEGLNDIIKFCDARLMRAQLRGVHTLAEVTMSKKCDDLDKLSRVTNQIVERYDMDGVDDMPCLKYPIKYYMVGNELKVFFSGTEKDYFEILKTTHDATKSAYPEAKIVQPAIAEGPVPTFWNNLFKMGAAEYFDISNVHEIHNNESSIWAIRCFDEYSKEKGIEDKPKWVTEIQFEQTNDLSGSSSLSSEEYAKIMSKYFVYALVHGYEKLFVVNSKYPIPEDPHAPWTDASAMIDSNDEKTRVYHTVQTVASKLNQFTDVEIIREELFRDNHRVKSGQYKFTVDEKPVYVLWGEGDLPVELEGMVVVTDIKGNTQRMNADAVTVTDAPIFVESAT